MMNNGGGHPRNFLTSDGLGDSSGHLGAVNNGLSQSYRNVGVANIIPSQGSNGGRDVYDKMRNSYQNPNGSYDIVNQGSFNNQN
jgi:hypothetical protein